MCTIYGMGFLKDHTFRDTEQVKNILFKLASACQSGGRDATGFSFAKGNKLHVMKDNMSADRFVKEENVNAAANSLITFDSDDRLYSIVGHCRMQTKGTHRNNLNNHPITAKNVVGVHNGMVYNDDELFKKYSDEKYIERAGQVDSEAFFRFIDYFAVHKNLGIRQGIKATSDIISGWYACAMHSSTDTKKMWLFRASTGTDIWHFKKSGIIIFATRSGYVEYATKGHDLGPYSILHYKQHSGIEFDLETKKATTFDIKKPREFAWSR